MKILIFGASGMIGSAMFRVLHEMTGWEVWGTLRSKVFREYFPENQRIHLIQSEDLLEDKNLEGVFNLIKPNLVINCIGLTKHHRECEDPIIAIPINALLPHKMAHMCKSVQARFIHISTDCVFSGSRGGYIETDAADARDVYGKSKYLGEVIEEPNSVTLRTSTIGHELHGMHGLLEWFLSQENKCYGFKHAIFSGLTNTAFAKVVRDYVIPHHELQGLFHIGSEAIAKYDLLKIISQVYNKDTEILCNEDFVVDRSLNFSKFTAAVGYKAPVWKELIIEMHGNRPESRRYV